MHIKLKKICFNDILDRVNEGVKMNIKENLKEIAIIIISSFIYVIGTNIFLAPVDLYALGIPGFARQISDIVNMFVNVGDITTAVYYLINIPIMILSFKYLGKKFSIQTLIMIFFIGLFSGIIPDDITVVANPILAVFASGSLMGAGLGYVLNIGASTGGTDPIAIYYSLYKNKSVGSLNFILNGIIVLLAAIINTNFETIILMVMLLFVWKIVVDYIHNVNQKITLILVTNKLPEIREVLLENSYRGCTYWSATGAYEQQDKQIAMITISKAEYYKIIDIVKTVDDNVWINSIKSDNVVGKFNNYYETNILKR